MSRASAVGVVDVYPDLLGTYGDAGNATVLAKRLAWRGIPVELVRARSGDPLPASGDVYCLGGGEDAPQARAAALLIEGGALRRAVEAGSAVLAVCAGYQIIGRAFAGPGGAAVPGAGLIDVVTGRGRGKRAVGEILVAGVAVPEEDPALGLLTGYENHAGVTRLGGGVRPLGMVVRGVGNGDGSGTEGAIFGRIVGTYLHGPVLARNPRLADMLLAHVIGPLQPLADADRDAERLREERIGALRRRGVRRTGAALQRGTRRWGSRKAQLHSFR